MSSKTQLREEFYAAVLPVIKQQLPGIRGDLQRRISKEIASKLSVRVHAAYEECDRLSNTVRELSAKLYKARRQQTGFEEVAKAITYLEKAKRNMSSATA